jgi:hypothetical protein
MRARVLLQTSVPRKGLEASAAAATVAEEDNDDGDEGWLSPSHDGGDGTCFEAGSKGLNTQRPSLEEGDGGEQRRESLRALTLSTNGLSWTTDAAERRVIESAGPRGPFS